jgi:PEGA domain-containing protein
MDLKFVSIPAVVLAATTMAAAPALAQRRGGEPRESRQAENRTENRGQAERRSSGERAQPRAEAPRPTPAPAPAPAPRAEQRTEQRAEPRRETGRLVEPWRADRGSVGVPRAQTAPRAYGGAVAVPRTTPRYDNRYYGHYDNHAYYYGGRYYPGPWRGYYGYAPYHPYYFRPRFTIGFGIYVGYPVAYYAYPYPVPVYGYGAPYGTVTAGPSNYSYGGVALQITPGDAAVYVDGTYAGVVADFDGSRQPLTLTAGTHHIEVVQNGFEPWAFDVNVQPGMVIPYQGSLRPY